MNNPNKTNFQYGKRFVPLGSSWTLRSVPRGYFVSLNKTLLVAVAMSVLLGLALPRRDWADVAAIATGPAMVLLIGSRIKKWHEVILFQIVYLVGLILTPVIKKVVLGYSLYVLQRFDYSMVGLIAGSCLLVSTIIWILLRVVRGTPVVIEVACPNCTYSLIGNTSGVCPECGTSVPFERLGVTERQFFEMTSQLCEEKT